MDEGLIIHSCRLLVPRTAHPKILHNLHESHQGLVRMKQRAQLTVCWPGLDNDIDNVIASCQICQDHQPSNYKEPAILKPRPVCPFQEAAADLCMYGCKQFLIIVDCYTDWLNIIPMKNNMTKHHLIATLYSKFCRMAIPDILWSDGGPQFTAKAFHTFAVQWRFTCQTSSPRYPQSNGKIEATVG